MLKKIVPWLLLVILLLVVFKAWFGFGQIAAGDTWFFFEETIEDSSLTPYLWLNNGLGQYNGLLYPFAYFVFLVKGLSYLGFYWSVIARLAWYWPFLGLSLFSSWYFFKSYFPQSKLAFLAPLIYLFNSYTLMIIGGGQISVGLACAIFPLTFTLLTQNLNQKNLKNQLVAGLVLSFQVAFEPRIAALVILMALLYAFLEFRFAFSRYFNRFLVPLVIMIGAHFYWLLPLVLLKRTSYASDLSSLVWVKFLSFADFSKSLSLLHPNWPENIFGKTYFTRPEFLVLPLLAFSALILVKKTKPLRNVLFFSGLALTGAFLAKGSQPPFGGVYLWLFSHVPGMNLFRDPTKFYVLVALSYTFLIPFSLEKLARKGKKKIHPLLLIITIFIIYWLFLIKPAVSGNLSGTFETQTVPQEYITFRDFIDHQEGFFRTLWLPKKQRFGFYDHQHPAINGYEASLDQGDLEKMGVKYLIVPYDSEEEIFLKDRQYEHRQRLALESELDQVSWLKKLKVADRITVYETPRFQDHFFVIDGRPEISSWQMINPTKYQVQVKEASQPFELIFSETYDHFWQAKIGSQVFTSTEFKGLNLFSIDQIGDFEIIVEFTAQKYVYLGLVVSVITLLTAGGILIWRFLAIDYH